MGRIFINLTDTIYYMDNIIRTKDMTKNERRNAAFKGGKRYAYPVCVLCGRARISKSVEPFKITENPEVMQVRYGIGGHASGGFYKKEDESINLKEAREKNMPIFQNLKEEITKLYKLLCD